MFLAKLALVQQPWFLILLSIWGIATFIFIINFEKFLAWRLRRQERKRLQKLAKRFPDAAAKLNPDAIKEQNAMEQEQRDREEFERIAKEHPEWLK